MCVVGEGGNGKGLGCLLVLFSESWGGTEQVFPMRGRGVYARFDARERKSRGRQVLESCYGQAIRCLIAAWVIGRMRCSGTRGVRGIDAALHVPPEPSRNLLYSNALTWRSRTSPPLVPPSIVCLSWANSSDLPEVDDRQSQMQIHLDDCRPLGIVRIVLRDAERYRKGGLRPHIHAHPASRSCSKENLPSPGRR